MSYGRRLTDREYEVAITDLYRVAPSMPSKAQDRELRRREFSLMIDHRLGVAFPEHLRRALWDVQEKVERRRLRLVATQLLKKLRPGALTGKAHSLANVLVDEYAKVIGREDAERFFGLAPGEPPSLPINSDR